jgi:hypothetical protein
LHFFYPDNERFSPPLTKMIWYIITPLCVNKNLFSHVLFYRVPIYSNVDNVVYTEPSQASVKFQ